MRSLHRSPNGFQFLDSWVPYASHGFATERQVEIPLGLAFLRSAPHRARVLEVGNVLSEYGAPAHTVVDRYEVGPGVVNEDILTFSAGEPFDRIVSISTLEHVGFDEVPMSTGKFRAAVNHLMYDLLRPGGEFLATLPIGYSPEVDAWLDRAARKAFDVRVLRRRNVFNDWEEAPKGRAAAGAPARRFPGASMLAVVTAGVRSLHESVTDGHAP